MIDTTPIVAVVSDSLLFRKTFLKLLAAMPATPLTIEVSASCFSVEQIPLNKVSFVLLDCADCQATQISELLLTVLTVDPEANLITVIDEADDVRVAAAMDMGAMGVIVKATPPQTIIDTLERILTGERCRPAPTVTLVAEDLPAELRQQLTARQQKMLRAMMGGNSVTATARQLDITPAKVVTQMREILAIVRGR